MKKKYTKIGVLIFIVLLILFIISWAIVNRQDYSQTVKKTVYGVTFSHKYAWHDLGLDWTKVYWDMLNELKPTNLRLVAYWDMIEERDDEFNFADLDWMVSKAEERDIKVVLALGRRTPRWPECHEPAWTKNLSTQDLNSELFEMLEATVKYFRKYDNIVAWQVENEPLFKSFGNCPEPDEKLLQEEINLVRNLDERPILITDTGELSNWKKAASMGDIFGTTMYKTVWTPLIGVWRYPLPAMFYYKKAQSIKDEFNLQKVIVAELQAEPWGAGEDIVKVKVDKQLESFDLYDLDKNLRFAKKAGFGEVYLWGVEWWYWMKEVKGHPEFWERAESIWQEN